MTMPDRDVAQTFLCTKENYKHGKLVLKVCSNFLKAYSLMHRVVSLTHLFSQSLISFSQEKKILPRQYLFLRSICLFCVTTMDLSLLRQVSQVQLQIIRYEEPIILVLGNFGNVINILIFGRGDLRKNVCSWYFICLSLAHLLLLDSFCLSRIIVTLTGDNVFQYISSLCKLRAYAIELSILLSRYFLCLISIDRWMITSSSAWLRQQSSARVSRWLIITGMVVWPIFSLHAPVGYQPTPIECLPSPGSTYELFVSIESIIISITPILIMSIFSVLTVLNVRSRVNRRTQPAQIDLSILTQTQRTIMSNVKSSRQRFKRSIQLVRLSLYQVILYLLLKSLWSMIPLYGFLTGAQAVVSINQRLMTLFLGRIGLNLLFTYAAVRFFVLFF
jgi:hypothetical protein